MAARNTEGDDEDLFLELEKDDDHLMDRMREKRMQQLKFEFERKRQEATVKYGTYDSMTQEKQIMLKTTQTEKMIIHFSHKDFKKCAVMDKHLQTLARKHHQTRFVKVDVENVPFLVERMEIKVLPCIVMFLNGIGVDRLIGFEGVSEGEDFPTWMLEKRLALSKVIEGEPKVQNIFKFKEQEGSDDEWDD